MSEHGRLAALAWGRPPSTHPFPGQGGSRGRWLRKPGWHQGESPGGVWTPRLIVRSRAILLSLGLVSSWSRV